LTKSKKATLRHKVHVINSVPASIKFQKTT
jgi:hypothetical protein